jgi:hypothetical protein
MERGDCNIMVQTLRLEASAEAARSGSLPGSVQSCAHSLDPRHFAVQTWRDLRDEGGRVTRGGEPHLEVQRQLRRSSTLIRPLSF